MVANPAKITTTQREKEKNLRLSTSNRRMIEISIA